MPPGGWFEINPEAEDDFRAIARQDRAAARQLLAETGAIKDAVGEGAFEERFGGRLRTTNGRSLLPVGRYFIGLVRLDRDVMILAYLTQDKLGDWAAAALQPR